MRMEWRRFALSPWTWGVLLGVGGLSVTARCLGATAAEIQAVDTGMVALLMVVWWSSAILPLWITSCIPLLAWPCLGKSPDGFVADVVLAASPYADAYSLLFLGGMVLGVALETTGLNRRIALHVLVRVGFTPGRLVLGVLLATGIVSAWISNTATTVMMLPIALALIRELGARTGRRAPELESALLLAVAYGSSVGGIATKIGSATNSIAAGTWEQRTGTALPFFDYSLAAVPFAVLMMAAVWWVLAKHAREGPVSVNASRVTLDQELHALGPLSKHERRAALVFVTAVVLWMLGDILRPHVQEMLGVRLASRHYEAGVSGLAALAALLLRTCGRKELKAMPFSALLLLGGSFSMAAGLEMSGLTSMAGSTLASVLGINAWSDMTVVALASVMLSAVASNTATITLLSGILPARLPLHLAACFGSSCDLMLPAGTPPNAIVHSTGLVPMRAMLSCGWKLDFAAMVLLILYGALLLSPCLE